MVAKGRPKQAAVVLLSGGIDSTACVQYYLDMGFQVKGLFVDYGQRARENEQKSATQIAEYYHTPLDRLMLSPAKYYGPGEIRGRNAFLVISALLFYPSFKGILSLGIHSGAPYYYDCSESFMRDVEMILGGYTNGEVVADAPFLKWDKPMIYNYCRQKGIPIHLTYSCEAGTIPVCGKCASCKDREALDAC
jgi:7-cyano-7-deazaguanine synthase